MSLCPPWEVLTWSQPLHTAAKSYLQKLTRIPAPTNEWDSPITLEVERLSVTSSVLGRCWASLGGKLGKDTQEKEAKRGRKATDCRFRAPRRQIPSSSGYTECLKYQIEWNKSCPLSSQGPPLNHGMLNVFQLMICVNSPEDGWCQSTNIEVRVA